jgi:hypothetical protein
MSDPDEFPPPPPIGDRPCAVCRAIVATAPGGVCPSCLRAKTLHDWSSEVSTTYAEAMESIPPAYLDDAPWLAKKLGRDPGAIAGDLAGRSVVISGPSGAAKTWLAVSLLLESLRAASTLVDGRLPDQEKRALVANAATSRYARAFRVGSVPPWDADARSFQLGAVLVVDDLGLEPASFAGQIVETICVRADRLRRTIVTSTFSPRELVARYGDGVVRRLFAEHEGVVLGERR